MSLPTSTSSMTVTLSGMQSAQSALLREYVNKMNGFADMPKPDAKCRSWEHGHAIKNHTTCQACNGTNRDPIPWREVMQDGSY